MVDHAPPRQSIRESDTARGLLFRIGIRIAALLFVAVLVAALASGMDPTFAALRALVVLLVLATCAWAAERVAQSVQSMPEPVAEPPPAAKSEDARAEAA